MIAGWSVATTQMGVKRRSLVHLLNSGGVERVEDSAFRTAARWGGERRGLPRLMGSGGSASTTRYLALAGW